MQKAKLEAKEEEGKQLVISMHRSGLSLEQIGQIAGLTEDQVQEIL